MDRNPGYRYTVTGRAYVTRPQQTQKCQSCEAKKPVWDIDKYPIAMAYVPWQMFDKTYSGCEALKAGTIFPELNLPFERGRCCK